MKRKTYNIHRWLPGQKQVYLEKCRHDRILTQRIHTEDDLSVEELRELFKLTNLIRRHKNDEARKNNSCDC